MSHGRDPRAGPRGLHRAAGRTCRCSTPTARPALARSGVLLDARAGERYRGETEPIDPVAGHIPGRGERADRRRTWPRDGRFLARGRAARQVRRAGRGGRRARSASTAAPGVTAAHEVLALELAGIPAALYVGSWSNWVADPARPVATGPGAG